MALRPRLSSGVLLSTLGQCQSAESYRSRQDFSGGWERGQRSRWRTIAVMRIRRPQPAQRSQQGMGWITTTSAWWQAQWHSSASGAWISGLMVGHRLTTFRISCGRNARRTEFYGPPRAGAGDDLASTEPVSKSRAGWRWCQQTAG